MRDPICILIAAVLVLAGCSPPHHVIRVTPETEKIIGICTDRRRQWDRGRRFRARHVLSPCPNSGTRKQGCNLSRCPKRRARMNLLVVLWRTGPFLVRDPSLRPGGQHDRLTGLLLLIRSPLISLVRFRPRLGRA